MAYTGPPTRGYDDENLSVLRMEGREPGMRRKKIAGYLKAANELRQSYTQSWNARSSDDYDQGIPGAFPGATVASSGSEEMIIFPSYARRHVKVKPRATPGGIQEIPGTGRDSRDTVGAGDAEFWREQWDKYEDDNAIVDVDVRGWLFTPHKGQMNRKQRLMVALARQLVGIPGPPSKASPGASATSSRSSSPTRGRQTYEEELAAAREAEAIVKRGEAEANVANQGGFSELPSRDSDSNSLLSPHSRSGSLSPSIRDNLAGHAIRRTRTQDSLSSIDPLQSNALHKRTSWSTPANMNASELAVANGNLMTRLKPFMHNAQGNANVSAFFYNDHMSRQKSVITDASGHFSFRAALDFVPTHVRILGSDKLSVQEEVKIVEPQGVSLISDIDDTVRHSAITSGAREIFRNAFIRDLGDLTIEGVKEWYNKLANMGVQMHYVSNSPWQLYPVLTSFFDLAGLPRGSFHLKQYSGMLQGIFEPVAERKKATLDKILRDFPERKFVLIGDSGEADLEVYTDVVMDNPGRVLGIFIRDVTMPPTKGFFDPSVGPFSGEYTPKGRHSRNQSTDSLAQASLTQAKRFTRPHDLPSEEEELRSAIAASLADMEEEAAKDRKSAFERHFIGEGERRPALPKRQPSAPAAPETHRAGPIMGDLIDLSDEPTPEAHHSKPPLYKTASISGEAALAHLHRSPSGPKPALPSKPLRLRSGSNASIEPLSQAAPVKAPPPKPRKPSTVVQPVSPSPLHQEQSISPQDKRPPPLPSRQTYRATAKQKISSAYNAVPSASGLFTGYGRTAAYSTDSDPGSSTSPQSTKANNRRSRSEDENGKPKANGKNMAAPPPPPRRGLSSYPTAAASYASNRLSGNWSSNEVYGGDSAASQPVNKREELWKRRWRRAKEIMDREGVMLRTWRVGSDVMDECITTVKKEIRQIEASGNSTGTKKVTKWEREVSL